MHTFCLEHRQFYIMVKRFLYKMCIIFIKKKNPHASGCSYSTVIILCCLGVTGIHQYELLKG